MGFWVAKSFVFLSKKMISEEKRLVFQRNNLFFLFWVAKSYVFLNKNWAPEVKPLVFLRINLFFWFWVAKSYVFSNQKFGFGRKTFGFPTE